MPKHNGGNTHAQAVAEDTEKPGIKTVIVFADLSGPPWCNFAHAAPPAVTSLFPAGGQRGTTVEVTAAGTFERWPVQAWASGRGLEVKAGKEKGKLTVTVAADATPGTYWLRLYDEQGASSPRPVLVGTLPE